MDRNPLFTMTSALLCLPIVLSNCNDPNCAVCNVGGINCEECKQSFTVSSNKCIPCTTNCLTCTANGYCQSCSPGFWGYQCSNACPNNCNEVGCEMVSGNCFQCKLSWYGPQCQRECNRCENSQCELLKCSTGCKDGYVQEIYNGLSNCFLCPLFCKKCSNASLCTECYTGHYIHQYIAPVGIVATCLNCSSKVPKCADCTHENDRFVCRSCDTGFVINQDNQCVATDNVLPCINCKDGCDMESRCNGGCQPGWTGIRCNYKCSDTCETCINQDTCLSCKNGFYTQTCTVLCNENCQSGKYPRCGFVDGYCTNGCNKGFWGDQCEYNCNNNCLDITTAPELCHRNGTCYYGCKSGYMGSDCSLVSSFSTSLVSSTLTTRASTAKPDELTASGTTSLKRTKPDENTPEANVQTDFLGSQGPAIGGSIAGGYVLGVLTAVVVFYLRKRILQKDKDRTQSKNTYYNVSIAASHEERTKPDTDRQPDSKDTDLESASRQSEATLYEKLSEQNKGNVYDHLEQPSENEYRQTIIEFGSNVEYYNH